VGDRLPPDLPKVDVPMLVIQGDDDQMLPHPETGGRLPDLISDRGRRRRVRH
jgi:non-heme chloroperoxidase